MKPDVLSQNRGVWIDAIRAMAAQAVVLGHLKEIFFKDGAAGPSSHGASILHAIIWEISQFPQAAVMVFFVISGYLVGGKLWDQFSGASFDCKRYALDRVSRLWVVLLPGLVLTALLDSASMGLGTGAQVLASRQPFYPDWWLGTSPFATSTLVANALFLQTIVGWQFGSNLSVWSLCNEFMYYALMPAMLGIWWLRGPKRIAACLVAVICLALFVFSNKPHFPDGAIYFLKYFAVWMLGAAIPLARRTPFVKCAFAVFGIAAIADAIISSKPVIYGGPGDFAVAALSASLIILAQYVPSAWIKKPAKVLSSYSYSLYVIHLPGMFLLLSLDTRMHDRVAFSVGSDLRFIAYVVAANLMGYILAAVSERHTTKVRAWAYRIFAVGIPEESKTSVPTTARSL